MTPTYGDAISDVIGGIRAYDMWGLIGWQEIRRRYRRTIIGPFWASVSLAVFVVALGIVWSQLWRLDPKQYLPFLASGMACWLLFSSFVTEGCSVFVSAEPLIKQLRVPYMMFVCAMIWRNVIVFGHNFLVYILVCIYSQVALNWNWLWIIPGLVALCVNGTWIALVLGTFCSRYRDIQQVVASLLQVSMFVTPIMWPPTQLTGRAAYLVDYNLLYHYIEIVRDPMIGQPPSAWSWFVVIASTIVGWCFALWLYARFRRRIAYWV
jgi:ABC-type polysaccharide/polyol phosphate export permease